MASRSQLLSLSRRMLEAQRELLTQAAEADMLPTNKALSQIANYEQALVALEMLIEEHEVRSVSDMNTAPVAAGRKPIDQAPGALSLS